GVVAGAAGEDIDARVAGERIVAAAAGDVLDAGHRGEAGGAAGGEIDGHRAGRAGVVQRVDAGAAVDRVGAVAHDVLDQFIPGITGDDVVAQPADERVIAGATVQRVS